MSMGNYFTRRGQYPCEMGNHTLYIDHVTVVPANIDEGDRTEDEADTDGTD